MILFNRITSDPVMDEAQWQRDIEMELSELRFAMILIIPHVHMYCIHIGKILMFPMLKNC